MNKTINVSVRNKIAVLTNDVLYICGNSDFVVDFDFDDEWDEFYAKTARFIYGGQYVDVVFEGNQCAVPVISNTYSFLIGVFAGNLRTTTPAYISAKKSILCEGGLPAAPTDDVYAQMVEMFNAGLVEIGLNANTSEQAKDAAATSEKNAKASENASAVSEQNTKQAEDAAKQSEDAAKASADRAKILADQVGTHSGLQADWRQNDPTNAGYVQNRTHYEEYVADTENEESIIIPLNNYYFNTHGWVNGAEYYSFYEDEGTYYKELEDGTMCHVLWRGKIYECAYVRTNTGGYIGNPFLYHVDVSDTGIPFLILFFASSKKTEFRTNSLSDFGTYTIKADIPKAVVTPIPKKFLDIAWDDVKNKPFSKTEFGDTLTWDGNTEGLDVCDRYYRVFGKVKGIAENRELFNCDNATYSESDGLAYDGNNEVQTDDCINLWGRVIITLKDNAFVSYCGMCFPKKGVYFYGRNEGADAGFVWVSSFTVPGFNFTNEEMDDELLPDSVVQNGAASLTLSSPRGNLFNITVDDNGNITATKVTT